LQVQARVAQQLDKQKSVGADHRTERLLGEHFQQQ
jgi:hypothetical protein